MASRFIITSRDGEVPKLTYTVDNKKFLAAESVKWKCVMKQDVK